MRVAIPIFKSHSPTNYQVNNFFLKNWYPKEKKNQVDLSILSGGHLS